MVQYQWFEIKFNLLGGLTNKNENKGTYFVKKQNPVSLKIHQENFNYVLTSDFHALVRTYEARVHLGTRVRVRVRVLVRDSAIFEKVGCGCGGTRRLKNY